MSLSPIKEKLLIVTLAMIQFINILDFMVMMPLGPQFIRVFSINAQQFSILISAYTISAGVAGFVGSFILDSIERKKALLIILSGFIVGTFFCALSPTYNILLMSRLVTGAFGGLLATLVLSILGDSIPEHRRGKAMGLVMMSFSIASIFGVPTGLFLATTYSWKAPFFLIACVGIVVFFISLNVIPILKEHLITKGDPKQKSAIVEVFNNKNQLYALCITLAIMLGQFAIIPLISTYMVTNVGFTEYTLTYLYIFGGIAAMIIAPLSGRLGDRFGKFPVFMIFSLLLTLPIFGITNLGNQPLLFPLIVSTLLFTFSSGRMVCGMALILSSVDSKHRGGFMSLNTAIQQLGAGVAAFIAGSIVTLGPSGELQHYNYVGYWAIFLAFVSIFIASKVKPAELVKSESYNP
jgi:predicted MFS family arabinose efflux permease